MTPKALEQLQKEAVIEKLKEVLPDWQSAMTESEWWLAVKVWQIAMTDIAGRQSSIKKSDIIKVLVDRLPYPIHQTYYDSTAENILQLFQSQPIERESDKTLLDVICEMETCDKCKGFGKVHKTELESRDSKDREEEKS